MSDLAAAAITGARGILEGIGGLARDVRGALTGELDAEKRAELALKAQEIEAGINNVQAEINKTEAEHKSVFVAGWRPALGWICAAAIGYHFILSPLAVWIARLCGATIDPPVIDVASLMTLVVGMLGLGAYRTYEKTKGVQGQH